jgi:hypothetical protein
MTGQQQVFLTAMVATTVMVVAVAAAAASRAMAVMVTVVVAAVTVADAMAAVGLAVAVEMIARGEIRVCALAENLGERRWNLDYRPYMLSKGGSSLLRYILLSLKLENNGCGSGAT